MKRNPEDARFVDAIWALRKALGKHPKWCKFQLDEDVLKEQKMKKREASKKERPEGAKTAKTAAADKKLIKDLVGTASNHANDAQGSHMPKVTTAIDVMSQDKPQR